MSYMASVIVQALHMNTSTGSYNSVHFKDEGEAINAVVVLLYTVISPIIFVFVIFILLWYIVILIFR